MASPTIKSSSETTTRATPRAWSALTPPLAEWIIEATSAMGFERMTPVQANTIPLFKGNKDVVVEAVTGSGKTLAFLIPVVEKLLRVEEPIRKHHVGAIIISPTRELASQIHSVLISLLAFHAPSVAAMKPPDEDGDSDNGIGEANDQQFHPQTRKVIPQLLLGGASSPAQDLAHFLKHSPNLLISTPGRLLELLSSVHVHCPQSSFEVLVLDEADRLLDLGFKADLQKILQRLPKQRRTGLFSASVSEAVDQLVRVGLRNPVRIAVKVKSASGADDKKTPSSLQMTYLVTRPNHKFPNLAQILRKLEPTPQKSIIYLSTCAAVDYFSHLFPTLLNQASKTDTIVFVPLHGKQTPAIRQKNFTRFISSHSQTVLLTTDVAARGLDIPTVDLVVQLDPPSDPKVFLHRCGRAGRAGRRGLAIVFLTEGREEDYVPLLAVRQTPVEPFSLPTKTDLDVSDDDSHKVTEQMRALVLRDRALHEKGQRAFVSWVQSYSKHAASSVFRIQDLDWQGYAEAWGLLKMPRMPELKKAKWEGSMDLGLSVDWKEFAYKDKKREEKRKKELVEGIGEGVAKQTAPRKRKDVETQSWSEQKAHMRVREERRERKRTKMEMVRKGKMTETEKEQDEELRDMIEKVKRLKRAERDTEFEGFGD